MVQGTLSGKGGGMCMTDDFILTHRHDDVRQLALQADRFRDVDMRHALVQIEGWQLAEKKKLPWAEIEGIMYPEHLAMEQCSSGPTAEYKRRVVMEHCEGRSMADLTGGLGVDCWQIGSGFREVTYIERNPELCALARHNFKVLGLGRAEIVEGDSISYLSSSHHYELIFIDPARRDTAGRKVVTLSHCTPDMTEVQDQLLSSADVVMAKLSPLLDLPVIRRQLKCLEEIHVVSVDGECKEIVTVQKKDSSRIEPMIFCVNMKSNTDHYDSVMFTETEEKEAVCEYTSTLGAWLYEPNASIMKAQCFRTLASRFSLRKLHPNSHLYTSDEPVDGFPGRCFIIKGVSSFDKKELKHFLSSITHANITVRNFPSSAEDVRRKLRLKDGGDSYIFATTLDNNAKTVILCGKK